MPLESLTCPRLVYIISLFPWTSFAGLLCLESTSSKKCLSTGDRHSHVCVRVYVRPLES